MTGYGLRYTPEAGSGIEYTFELKMKTDEEFDLIKGAFCCNLLVPLLCACCGSRLWLKCMQ